jgi:hypothetical protein
VIVRILGEGQWDVADAHIEALNALDARVETAVTEGDDDSFASSLEELLRAIRTAGHPLPDDSLVDSDLILPPSDATIEEVRELLGDDGLIPG